MNKRDIGRMEAECDKIRWKDDWRNIGKCKGKQQHDNLLNKSKNMARRIRPQVMRHGRYDLMSKELNGMTLKIT